MTGYVFSGGRSTRMGRNKATLVLSGRTLLAISVARLEPLCSAVFISGEGGIADIAQGQGPLAALIAVLEHAAQSGREEIALITGVDTPFLPAELLREVAARIESTSAEAVVPFAAGYPQPLCGAYRATLAPCLRECFSAGERRLMGALRMCCRPDGALDEFVPLSVPEAEAQDAFFNLNTPQDFAEAERRLAAGPSRWPALIS